MGIETFVKNFKKTFDSLEEDEQAMIQGVVELSDISVKEIMVPRIDTEFLAADMPRDEVLQFITNSEHSRFPVYKDTIDNVIGVLYVKDVLKSVVQGGPFDLASIVKKAYFVPESKHIDNLLRELKKLKVHIAIVVDEYGGVSGIICMEDIIEEIVGDIQDEFDNEKEDAVDLGGGAWLCDARINLDDLAELTGVVLPSEDFDTLGGFVFDLFGKIPVKGEKAAWDKYDFIVEEVDGHKIETVKITKNSG
jgi:CBS domain containing-hemolysin-like protein